MNRLLSVMFFPIDIGLAHTVRPYAIAEEMQRRGHKVFMALPKKKQSFFSRGTVPMVDIESYIVDESKIRVSAFSDYNFLKNLVDQEVELIRRHEIDVVVSDFRITALAAGMITGKKTYHITNGDGVPHSSYLPNPGFHPWMHKLALPIVQKAFDIGSQMYLRPLLRIINEAGIKMTFDEWFRKIEQILPEPSFHLPPVDPSLTFHYVGPLQWGKFDRGLPSWFGEIEPDGKTIYLSFGGTGFDKEKLINIALALVDAQYRVVVTTGTVCEPGDFPPKKNLYVAKFLPSDEVCKKVDLVVCHGGHGTMMGAIKAGKPVVAVPFNPDQVVHSTRMQELGVAKTLMKLNLIDVKNIFTFNWKAIEDKGKRIDPQTVVHAVKDVFANISRYHEANQKFNHDYAKVDGAKDAADIIEATTI